MDFWRGKSVLVTGASSGIGAAVARACAQADAEALVLWGRDAARLEQAAAACREAGCADVVAECVDVRDRARVEARLAAADERRALDVVFANAGRATGRESDDSVRETVAVNVTGTVDVALAALARMRTRMRNAEGRGRVAPHLVLTSSIAGYAPLAGCPSYAASKAFVKAWGLSLRGALRKEGVCVNVVCPGFVRSRITDRNTCPMPFFMEADAAARIILDGVARDAGLIAFPRPLRLATWLLSILPWRLAEALARRLPAKNEETAKGFGA